MHALVVLELLRPPEGYRLERAVFLTHDLDTSILTEQVLPTLAGELATERAQRLGSIARLDDDSVTVAYAADRLSAAGVTPSACLTLLPVTGRRQHAKLHVLRFTRTGAKGPTTRWRVVVTSANLTRSGVSANHEVYAVDDVASDERAARPSLLPPALAALGTLAGTTDVNGKSLRRAVAALADRMPSRLTPAGLAHSLDSTRDLLGEVGDGPYQRLLLCAPTFSGADTSLGRRLLGTLSAGATVDVVVPRTDAVDNPVPVPQGLLDVLSAAGHHVMVHAVPLFDRDGVFRRLHGKQYVAEFADGTGVVVLGSANLTRRGLEGRNRELVLRVEVDDAGLVASTTLRELRAAAPNRTQSAPALADALADDVAGAAPQVPFWPRPGSSPSGAMLGVLGDLGDPSRLRVFDVGEPWRPHNPGDEVVIGQSTRIHAKVGARFVPATVVIRCEDESSFWQNVPRDDDPQPSDPLLRALLRDVARQRAGGGSTMARAVSVEHGRFDLPDVLWLNVVARHRQRLRAYSAELQLQVQERLGSSTEREVAKALITDGVDPDGTSPALIEALMAHLERSEAP